MNQVHNVAGASASGKARRHFTVAVFVVDDGRVVLMKHPRLGIWLPPGGHIEPGELPDEAALREVKEETGLDIVLLGDKGPDFGVRPLTRPAGIQLEPIGPGHEHIDLVYFAAVREGASRELKSETGTDGLGWYTLEQAAAAGANREVLSWIAKAIAYKKEHSGKEHSGQAVPSSSARGKASVGFNFEKQ